MLFQHLTLTAALLISICSLAETSHSPDHVFESDSISPIDRPPERAEPAVWGDPAPNYSAVQLDGSKTYLYSLIFVDSKITRHYEQDMATVRREILKMIREANEYFIQFNVRISVVDVLETKRDDLSLYTFQDFHTRRIRELPYHDFAALISFRYAGGLAYVSGMCTHRNILLSGFYPHNPEAMGAIFFHETAHLLGVPHDNKNETIAVDNCACNSKSLAQEVVEAETYRPSVGCLKIPGFDHDCTAQYLANVVSKNRCLSKHQRYNSDNIYDGYPDWAHAETGELSMCGNGVVETLEECDCGPLKTCDDSNCIALTCKRKVPLYIFFLGAALGFGVLFVFCSIGCYCVFRKVASRISASIPSNRASTWTRIACQPIKFFKRIIRIKGRGKGKKTASKSGKNHVESSSRLRLNAETVVSLTPDAITSATGTLRSQRPQNAPPPVPCSKPVRPSVPPPRPKPFLKPCMVPLIDALEEQSHSLEPPTIRSHFDRDIEDSISAKFADFDDDDEVEGGEEEDEFGQSDDEMI